MINIPMNVKPPMRLDEVAALTKTKTRQPHMLGDIPQPSDRAQQAQPRQPVNRAQPRQPVDRIQQIQQPVNRAQATGPSQILPGIKPGLVMKKGQKASLTQNNPGLEEINVCLGWKARNPMCDMDASAFLLGADNRVIGEEWFVFYGQTSSPDGSVVHHGDNRNGTGSGDAEILSIQLKRVNPAVKKIVFIITINEALQRGLNFGMASDTYIRVADKSTGSELVRYVLDEYYSNVTSMIVGELYQRNGEWKFNAVGNGVARDLAGLCELYGVQASY